jgi:tRNA 2-selenouridine synthase
LPYRLMLIGGGTGTAKTALLHQLASQGAQILDLEGIACHRGSLFGGINTTQPAQKMFETRIAAKLATLDPMKITFVEAESSKIGERIIPPSLWALMVDAKRIHVTAPLTARSAFLCRAYADLTQDKAALGDMLERLRPYHSGTQIARWHAQARTGDWQTLAAGLISDHYDPRYAKSAAHKDDVVHRIEVTDLDDSTLERTAESLHAQFS